MVDCAQIDHSAMFATWRSDTMDPTNTERYLKHLGVGYIVRNAGKNMTQDIKIEDLENGAGIHIITSTKLTTTDDNFYFKTPRNVTTKDGRKSTVIFSIEHDEDGWYLYKTEAWTDGKGVAHTAWIKMRVQGDDKLIVKMHSEGFEVNRVHVKI